MKMRKLLLLITALLTLGVSGAWAQKNVIVGERITEASQLESGTKYLLQYDKVNSYPFIDDFDTGSSQYYYVPEDGNSPLETCVYKLIKDGDNWKIQNHYTLKYWPTGAASTQMASVAESSAGLWSLEFSSGNITPKSNTYGLDRASQKLGTYSSSNKIRIYKITMPATDETPVVISAYNGKKEDDYKTNTPTKTDYLYGNYSAVNGASSFTTNVTSGLAGVVVSTTANILKPTFYSGANYYHSFAVKPGNQTKYTITFTAPTGYYISGYSLNTISTSNNNRFTLTIGGENRTIGSSSQTFSGNNSAKTFSFDVQGQTDDGELCFPALTVVLKPLYYTVTYNVVDAQNNILATTDEQVQEGTTVTTADLPTFLKRAYCTYSFDSQSITGNTIINATYSFTGAPFQFSATKEEAIANYKWYTLKIANSKYLYNNNGALGMNTELQNGDNYKWAIVGNPYSYKLFNKGANNFLYISVGSPTSGSTPAVGYDFSFTSEGLAWGLFKNSNRASSNDYFTSVAASTYTNNRSGATLNYYGDKVCTSYYLNYPTDGYNIDNGVLKGLSYAYVIPEAVTSYKTTLNSSGFATFANASASPVDFSSASGYTAWQITDVSSSNVITFAEVTGAVAGGTGLLLMGTADQEVSIALAATGSTLSENKLVGIVEPTVISAGQYYGLSGDSFVKVNAGTVPAGKALLPAGLVNESIGAKAFTFVFGGADGVTETRTVSREVVETIFDLNGRSLSQPQRGIHIVNGRKFIVK